MPIFSSAQAVVVFVLAVAALGLTAFAFVDALRRPAAAFEYASKRTKVFWAVLLGVALALAFVSVPDPRSGALPGILGILSVVAAGVYMADVRPAVRTYRGRGPRGY
ncbi:DUF2516 family protein [Aquipuribacter hungaricus]|uniref:DUF2516 family protein n=1 Tax=Aquipuribacter hungaricus TaxID=545624 RepID=A0ABV7WBD7_9MICO